MSNAQLVATLVVAALAVIGAVWTFLRAVAAAGVWLDTMTKNTVATEKLTAKVEQLSERVDRLERHLPG